MQPPFRSLEAPLPIDLRHLRYFLAVIEELHFGRAAERLHISQPPLSQAVRRLEDELGVKLLERTSRVVRPTRAGTVFAEQARGVLASFDVAVAESRRAGGASSALRVGCIPHLPMHQLQRLLAELHARVPSAPAHVTNLLSLEQVSRLRARELDAGVIYAQDHDDIEMERLFAGDPLAAFFPPDHGLAAKPVIEPTDLRDEVLVAFPRAANPALHRRLLSLIESRGYRFRDMYQASGPSARDVMLAVASGCGVALAPSTFTETGATGALVVRAKLDPPVSMPDTVVAWHADPPRQLRAVLATVQEVARELRRAEDADAEDRRAIT